MTNPRFQIISDLHMETPLHSPSYAYFSSPANFPICAPNLFLLGDIGLIAHTAPLLSFLRAQLSRSAELKIFYVLGNHEPYTMTLENAISKLTSMEQQLNSEFGPRFHIMNRRRVDIDATTTLLGCTLWSAVPAQHALLVASTLKDFSESHGITDRSLGDHNADHLTDLDWLNAHVTQIEVEEPHREIVVLTHHSPTTDARANSPRFPADRPLNTGFRTDLSGERCWSSKKVRVWAFGHTHFSCQFVDAEQGGRRKLVVSNQKGYAYPEGKGFWEIESVVVARHKGEWVVVTDEMTKG